jgi:hypothetical protein
LTNINLDLLWKNLMCTWHNKIWEKGIGEEEFKEEQFISWYLLSRRPELL